MTMPNEELMARYGTRAVYEEKLAHALPLAARVAAGVIGAGRARQNHQLRHEQILQAQVMNAQFRELLGMQMEQATGAMEHTRVPLMIPQGSNIPLGFTDGMVRLASAVGEDLAQLEKEATLFSPIANAVKNVGAAVKRTVGKAVSKPQASAEQARLRQNVSKVQTSTASRSSSVAPSAPPPQPQPAALQAPPAQPAPQPPPQAQPAAPQAPGMMDRLKADFGDGKWKWKAPAMGAMALGGYGVYRAGKGAFNWLGREPAPYQFNEGGSSPAHAVNQYGVPDRSSPFMY